MAVRTAQMRHQSVRHIWQSRAAIARGQPPERNVHSTASSHALDNQAQPLTGYYEELLKQPLLTSHPAPGKTEPDERVEKARIVFGSRLAGPGERKSELESKSTLIAGVLVPPRPTEPDNCCMSGCVNCVWDQFRDELEEWAGKSEMARRKLAQAHKQRGAEGTGLMAATEDTPQHVATSMDDDGGGTETNWSFDDDGTDATSEIMGKIPVGIREFMRTEKRLKQKHLQEGTYGG